MKIKHFYISVKFRVKKILGGYSDTMFGMKKLDIARTKKLAEQAAKEIRDEIFKNNVMDTTKKTATAPSSSSSSSSSSTSKTPKLTPRFNYKPQEISDDLFDEDWQDNVDQGGREENRPDEAEESNGNPSTKKTNKYDDTDEDVETIDLYEQLNDFI